MGKFTGIGSVMETEQDVQTSSLDLFSKEVLEKDLQRGYQSTYHPASMGDGGPYVFYVPPEGDSYIDTSTLRLNGTMTIKKPDPNNAGKLTNLVIPEYETTIVTGHDGVTEPVAQKIVEGDTVSFVNLAPYALFRSAEVSLNGELVSVMSTPCFPYKAYIENLFSYDKGVKHLDASLRSMDSAYRFDIWLEDDPTDDKNIRSMWTLGSKKVDFSIPLMIDVLNLDRLLPNNVEITLKLTRGPDNFALQSIVSEETVKYKIEVEDLYLSVQRVVPATEVLRKHARMFADGKRALFPITRSDIQTRQVSAGSSYVQLSSVFKGKLPHTILFGFVRSDAFNGTQKLNPFNFDHYNVSEAGIRVNSRPVPSIPYKMDFDNQLARRAYRGLFDSLGVNVDNASSFVSYEDFLSGYTFYGFSLCPDLCGGHFHHKHEESGAVDIEVRFAKATEKPLTAIIYASYNDTLEIDQLGKPHFSATA